MAYFAPYIDTAGLIMPSYQDIEDYLVEQARTIYGADIYLENDSQDFQLIAGVAQVIYDTLLSARLAYNNRSPVTAIGAALDTIVELNGIKRKGASQSVVTVTLTGTAYTNVLNGVVADVNGNLWNLPASVTLDAGGSASVTAEAQEVGPITALPGQVSIIITPTLGWTAVTNPLAASPGQSVETDPALRARQAVSVANPSQALTEGILGGVLSVDNVVSAQLYENDTGSIVYTINGVQNPDGYPAHSVTLVIDGGANEEIASQIAYRKTPGCYLDGDVIVTVLDQYGVPLTVRFYRPVEVGIEVNITIKALAGYTASIGAAAKQAIVDYLNSLTAGQSVIVSELWQAALSVDSARFPVFSLLGVEVRENVTGAVFSDADLELLFDEKATCIIDDVALVVT